jgi:uncharacterized protein (DUF2267 family)
MQYDEFLGKVQNRARLATKSEAVKASRATLEVLAQRLFGGEADDLAAQLPSELAYYMKQVESSESFDLDAFFERVAEREGVDLPDATHHSRMVMSVVREAITQGEFEDVLAQLPEDYQPLFELGSEGATS